MEIERITRTDSPLFKEVWEIYETSFPLFEQRTPEHQITAMQSDLFHFVAYKEEGKFIGFIGYWDFEDYLYIEHYAIDPELRGGGWGSKILKTLQQSTNKTIILEIDEVVDEVSARRLRFYRHLGLVVNPYIHPLHRYREIDEEHQEAQLVILTYPNPIDRQTYERFNTDLREIVMKR